MASDTAIQVAFVLQRDEFAKAYRITRRRLPRSVRWPAWVQCGFLAALVILPVTYQPNDELQLLPIIMLALLWGVLVMGSVASRALLNLQFARMDGKQFQYHFSDSGFNSSMLPDGDSRLSWTAVTRMIETDTLFVLIISGVSFYTIPKRAIAVTDIEALRKLLTEKITPVQH